MKLMKVFDISEFSEAFETYIYENIGIQDYIEIDMSSFIPTSKIRQELIDKGCELDEIILINT